MNQRQKMLVIAEAMQQSEWFGRAASLEPGEQFQMGALPEDSNLRIVGAATNALNTIRTANGRGGRVSITTDGHVTTVKASW